MKKALALLFVLVLTFVISSQAFAIKCDSCGQTFSEYCNKKHHSYGSYMQCIRQTNCDYRGDYFSNYYKDANGHELIANNHLHGIQHSYCGNSYVSCSLPPK